MDAQPDRTPERPETPGTSGAPETPGAPGVWGVSAAVEELVVVPELAEAWEHLVAARCAEAAKIEALLAYRDRQAAEHADAPLELQAVGRKAAARNMALLTGEHEQTLTGVLNAADYARETLPKVWEVFTTGGIDFPRVRRTAQAALADLSREKLAELDAAAAVQAPRRSAADYRRWLTRFVAQLDPEVYTAECARAGEDRYVRFEHLSNGMSYLEAYLPTLQAAAIQKRLRAAARGLNPHQHHHPGTGEDEHAPGHTSTGVVDVSGSWGQREADLLAAWLRDGRVYAAPTEAKIMVMIPEATLSGESEEPAMAADRSWMLPADQARALASDPTANHQWYHGVVRHDRKTADYDLLSARYLGRYPPARLRDALVFRDGVCQAPGCAVAAEGCDMDHQQPWHTGGPTTGTNLWALCRRHHQLKSHGYFHPPPGTEPPPGSHGKAPPGPLPPGTHPPDSLPGSLRPTLTWNPTPVTIRY